VALSVVLRAFYKEIGNPTQLAINVPILCHLRVIWHPSAFEFILFIGVHFPLWPYCIALVLPEALVEELLVMGVISIVELGRNVLVTVIPLVIVRSQHSIVCVLIHNQLSGELGICMVSPAELLLGMEDFGESLSPQRGLPVNTGYRRP